MRQLVLLLLALTMAPIFAPANLAVSSTPDIERRILLAIAFLEGQFHNGVLVSGYLHDGNISQLRSYTEDNALVALALSAYEETHFSTGYYADLQRAVQFVVAAQTAGGDFYEYYNFGNGTWESGGKFFYWDAIVLMSVAYAAFTITNLNNSERAFWTPIVDRLRLCVDNWLPYSMSQSGDVVFSFPNGPTKADLTYEGALLMGLMHIAAFEYYWGSKSIAAQYAGYSKRMANWLHSLQERNATQWGYGGFYSNESMSLQTSEESAFAMLGLNSYYKVIGLIEPTQRTELENMRSVMQEWEEGYAENITDPSGSVSFGRAAHGQIQYPRPTWTTSAMLAVTVDVWINLGPPKYWNDSSRIYGWLTGTNKGSTDMQAPEGNFYEGIDSGELLHSSGLATTMLALYSIIRADFVSIPGTYPITNVARTTRETNTGVSQTTMSKTVVAETTASQEKPSLPAVAAVVALLVVIALAVGYAANWKREKKRKRTTLRHPPHLRTNIAEPLMGSMDTHA